MVDYENLCKLIKETLDEKPNGALHMSSATYKGFEKYTYIIEEQLDPRAVSLYYGSQIYIDDNLDEGVVDVWV